MAAPTFVRADGGVVDTSGGFSSLGFGVGINGVGNVMICQILLDSTESGTIASSGTTGLVDLAGTAGVLTTIGVFDVGSAVAARQYLFIGRVSSTGSGVNAAFTNSGTGDVWVRLYEFADVHTGTTLSDVIENGSAGSTTNTAGTSATIDDAAVTTLGADRLALNFVAGNDDNALDAFTGMSGGTWAEAVAEFASATGTDGVIGLQTATIASAGTIDGGTDGWADAADSWGVVGFALKPEAAAAPASLIYQPGIQAAIPRSLYVR